MSSQLELRRVHVRYGDFEAVHDVSLALAAGDIGCLLGPSGCGKTTLLRAVAGFEAVSDGEIRLRDQCISTPDQTLPPEQRRVGMVFQDFALFPHLDIERNIGFGLNTLGNAERRERVAELLELIGLADHSGAYPHELSGGQQQRVALARAMAPRPEILLLDEPFSSLDGELREQLASEVRQILKQSRVTAILVTHDQHEAFAMADRITLLHKGSVAQTAEPYALYHNPADEFVAGFIGQGSIINAQVDAHGALGNGMASVDSSARDWQPGQQLRLLIRPDDVEYAANSGVHLSVISRAFRGAHYLYELALPDGQRVPCLTPSHVEAAPGESLPVQFNLKHFVVFPPR